MFKHFKHLLFVLAYLLLIGQAQDLRDPPNNAMNMFEGAQLPHLFSQYMVLDPGTGNIDFNQDYTLTIPQGIFTSTENVYIVAGISQLELGDFNQDQRVIFIDRTNTQVNAARTQFTLSLINQFATSATISWEALRYNILLIGSDFSGFSDALESSFIYGKLDDIRSVDPAVQNAWFDFDTNDEGSPFNYVLDADLGQGCGMIRKNGQIIIETNLCQFSRFCIVVAGFFGEVGGGFEVDVGSQRISTADVIYGDDNQDVYFRDNAADLQFGLRVQYNPTPATVRNVQLSFIHIGIREYANSVTGYPNQITSIDDFVVLVGSAREHGTFSNLALGSNGNIGFPDQSFIDLINRHKFGHAFCPADRIKVVENQDFVAELSYQTGGIDVFVQTNNPIAEGSFKCLLVGAKEICEVMSSLLKFVTTPDRITIDTNFPLETTINPTNPALSGTNLNPLTYFNYEPLPSPQVSEGTITLKYDRAGFSVFVMEIKIPQFAVGNYMEITAFGQLIFAATSTGSGGGMIPRILAISNDMSQDTVVISIRGLLPPGANTGGFAIRGYKTVFNNVLTGDRCTTTCPEKTGFELAVLDTTPFECTYCDISLFLEFNHFMGGCKCIDRYYQDANGDCQPCQDTLCRFCPPDGTVCSFCVNFAQKDTNGVCQCIAGYFPNNGECVKCPTACPTCSSATNCDSCIENQNTRGTAENGCPCLDGFYDDGVNAVCPACSLECNTCSGTAINCLTCRTTANFEKVGTTCVCRSGFYLLRTATAATCEMCDDTCLTCEDNSYNCKSCDPLKFRELSANGECKCIEGYVSVMGQCLDRSCRSVTENCQQCAYDYEDMELECIGCAGERTVVNGMCECSAGFYEKQGMCLKCGEGCQRCVYDSANDRLTCEQCAANSMPNGDGTCSCMANQLLVESAGILYCQPCSKKCMTCSGTPDSCDSCVQPFVYDMANKECNCPAMTYETPSHECMPCLPNCAECMDGTSCERCVTGYVGDGTQCELNCLEGTFKNAGQCEPCPAGCIACESLIRCSKCQDDNKLYAGSCRSECPAGTFAFEGVCYRCAFPCATCTDSADNCDSCVNTQVYFNGQCLDQCPDGTYFADGSCLVCNPKCMKCTGTATTCTACPGNQFLFNQDCFTQCPGVVIDGQCKAECPAGQFADGGVCNPCDPKCATCSGTAANCLRCANNFKTFNGDCVAQCPAGLLDNGFACLPCDPSCDGCSGTAFLCDRCQPQLIKVNGRCIAGCPAGQFYDAQQVSCLLCGRGCSQCRSLTQCEQCSNSEEVPVNGECVQRCPIGAQLINGECVCSLGNLHLNACVSRCPPTYYAFNRKCEVCQSPCRECSGSATNCLNCIEGFNFNPATQPKCTRTNQCQFGQYQDSNNVCQQICPNSFFYYKTVCVVRCPNGFEPNAFGGCVARTNPSICTFPQFQQGSSCVNDCGMGFFGNTATRMCQQCVANCMSCQNAASCVQCNPNYISVNGQCVLSLGCTESQVQYKGECMDNCPLGTGRQGRTCIRACASAETYFYQGFCYSTCPTGNRTDDACI